MSNQLPVDHENHHGNAVSHQAQQTNHYDQLQESKRFSEKEQRLALIVYKELVKRSDRGRKFLKRVKSQNKKANSLLK